MILVPPYNVVIHHKSGTTTRVNNTWQKADDKHTSMWVKNVKGVTMYTVGDMRPSINRVCHPLDTDWFPWYKCFNTRYL